MNMTAPNVQKFIYQANALSPYVANAGVYWCPAENATFQGEPMVSKCLLERPGRTAVSGNDIYSSYIMNGAPI